MKNLSNLKTKLLVLMLVVWSAGAWGQTTSYLGLDGGFEGTATIDNSAAYISAQTGKWCHSTLNISIVSELTIVRSGFKSVKVTRSTFKSI